MDENQTTPDSAPGGDGATVIDSLDLSNRRDVGLIRQAAKRRWKLSPRFMDRVPAALEAALDLAESDGDYKAIAVIVSTAATLEGQNQKDEQGEDGGDAKQRGPIQINIYPAEMLPPKTAQLPPGA